MPLLPPLPFPKINGHELSRTSIDLAIDAVNITPFFTAIDFESVRAPGMSHGSRSKPQARTRGKVTFPASITIYEHAWQVIVRPYLVAKGAPQGLGPQEVDSLITLVYHELSLGVGVSTIEIVGSQVTSAKESISDSDDQLVRVLTLSVMDIFENGVSAVRENTATGL